MRGFVGVLMAASMATGVFWQSSQAAPLSACAQGHVSQEGTCEDANYVGPSQEGGEQQETTTSGFPTSSCRFGYTQQGPRLCMTGTRGPDTFANAEVDCQDILGRVANYKDWRYRIFRGDGLPAPVGFWLGPMTGDNLALFVNLPNIADFDGETSRFDSRSYVCAHDDDF
jgi:hypothetical protein